ncbi:hypothetical protein MPSEU_000664200 [Mayamaea pseudoterrestris]|nr:hypothetical protein MPSEU_000664200 [Mayamaea pseudoterrestris]
MLLSRISSRSRLAWAAARTAPAYNASSMLHCQHRSMATLILADPLSANQIPSGATCSAVSAAQQFKDPDIYLLVVGEAPAQIPQGVTKMIHASSSSAHPTAETIASTTAQVAQSDSNVRRILGTSTKFGAAIVPRIAGLLESSPMTDVVAIESNGASFVRPMYAGNVLTRIKPSANASSSKTLVMSVRPTSFPKAALVDASSVTTEQVTAEEFAGSEWISDSTGSDASDTKIDLASATTVVSGGRGMKETANFELLAKLAKTLPHGAVGASRAAVDAGMAPNDWQVGQTGKVVAPNLYFAVGISGAIQHISGMKDSKVVVAINKDPDAPIFQVADYGLVADLFTAVPELTTKLSAGE